TAARPISLPVLHGLVSWAPGVRPAPAGTARGRTAVVVFLARGCPGCLTELRGAVQRLAPADRPAVLLAPQAAAGAYGVTPGRPVILLLDRRGNERTGYAFPFPPSFVQGDLLTLARERLR
ncbi:MAG: hypothetical protein ACYDBR_14955, partial [Gaiellaceae bacterium]